jgi:MFS family permease
VWWFGPGWNGLVHLCASGIPATVGNLGFYGSILFCVFLVGWGCAFLWGPIADRFGRVRALIFAILCYSLFTFLGCIAQNVWQLGVFRFLAGFGVGGEFVGAAVFVAEELPTGRRVSGAGYLNSGYYVGIFLAAGLNYILGARLGWRAMFAAGVAPALFVAFIRYGVQEPERWKKRIESIGAWTARDSLFALFSPEYRKRTTLNCLLLLVSMIGLWAGSVYVPGAVTQVALGEGYSTGDAARIASWATMLLATGTILGCLIMAPIADRIGRRGALAFFFAIMAVSIPLAFGYTGTHTTQDTVAYGHSSRACSLSGWVEAVSPCSSYGCRSSTAASAGGVPWPLLRVWADL